MPVVPVGWLGCHMLLGWQNGKSVVIKIQHAIECLLESPSWKTFFSVIIPAITGIMSGLFIAEISGPSGLKWSSFYHTRSFYGLLIIFVIIYLYNKTLYNHETAIDRFSNDQYCLAYMRSKCLPEAAENYRKKIREGQGGELTQVMEELKESLK